MTDPVLFKFQQKLEQSANQVTQSQVTPWQSNGKANPEFFLPGLKKKNDSGVSGDSHSDGTNSDSEKIKIQQKRIHSFELHGGKRVCIDDSDENINVDVVGSESENEKIDVEQHQNTINQFHSIMTNMSTRQRLFAQADRKRNNANRKAKIKSRLSELMKQVQYLQREYQTVEDSQSTSTDESSESCDEQAVNMLSSIILPGVESNVLEHIIRKELASLVVKVKDELQNMAPKQPSPEPEIKIEATPLPEPSPIQRAMSRDLSVKPAAPISMFKPTPSPLVSPNRTMSLNQPSVAPATPSTIALLQQKQQQIAQTQQQIAALSQQGNSINNTYQQAYQKALIQAKINQVEEQQKQQQQLAMNQALMNRAINPFMERTLSGFEGYPSLGMEDIYGGLHKEGLTPHHLKKAKLMFFFTRYPSSSVLKTFFPDVRFNRATTSQLIKWFSNFREFFYIHIEKIARQAISEGMKTPEELVLSRDSEIIRNLNNHYNKSNQFEVPADFIKVTETSCREFFMAIKAGKDQDPSWKKTIYKVICKLDTEIPNKFKAATMPELGD